MRTLLVIILLAFSLHAEERNFHISGDFSECNQEAYNSTALPLNFADFRYDSKSKEFHIEVEFISSNVSSLANGFHFGLNSESSLTTNIYKMAYFYVDARSANFDSDQQQVPRINAFIYNRNSQAPNNCNNNPGSWELTPIDGNPTEPILPGSSGFGGNPAWVDFAEVTQILTAGKYQRRFSIILNTSSIESFIPNNTLPFLQTGPISCGLAPVCLINNKTGRIFDFAGSHDKLTLDFVPSKISNSQYTNNSLSNLTLSTCSLCQVEEANINITPRCQSVSYAENVSAGEETQIEFQFTDPDNNDSHTVDYINVPSAAVLSPKEGQAIPAGDPKQASITWTPKESDIGMHTISASFIHNYGYLQSGSDPNECTANVNVLPIDGPVCEQFNFRRKLKRLRTSVRKQRNLMNKANRELKKFTRALGRKRIDRFGDDIKRYYQTATESIKDVPTKFVTCTSGFGSSCTQTDFFQDYNTYRQELQRLFCDNFLKRGCNFKDNLGKRLFRMWKQRYALYLIKVKGWNPISARQEANTRLKQEFRKKAVKNYRMGLKTYINLSEKHKTTHFSCN